jgi:hypothetical protein
MEVSGELHAPAALPLGKESSFCREGLTPTPRPLGCSCMAMTCCDTGSSYRLAINRGSTLCFTAVYLLTRRCGLQHPRCLSDVTPGSNVSTAINHNIEAEGGGDDKRHTQSETREMEHSSLHNHHGQ